MAYNVNKEKFVLRRIMKELKLKKVNIKEEESASVNFFGLMIVLFALFFVGCILAALFKGQYFIVGNSLFFQDYGDWFMDFFNVNVFLENMDPYIECGSSYPPFVLVMAKAFNYLTYCLAGGRFARATVAGVLAFILFLATSVVPTYFLLRKVFKDRGFSTLAANLTFIAFLCTAPFLYAFARGNFIFYSLLFSVIFFVYYKHDSFIVRELSYISLAISVGTKLYPAVFALILIREKRWGDFGRVVLYCACLVFLPFLMFEGGYIANVLQFITNLNIFSTQPFRFEYWGGVYTNFYSYGVSIQNFVRILFCKFTGTSMLECPDNVNIIAICITLAFMAILVFASMVTSKKWKHVCAMALVSILFPDPSYVYSMIFLFIPITMFFLDRDKKTVGDLMYLILFVLMLSPVQTGYFISQYFNGLQYGYTWSNLFEVIFMLILCVALFVDAIKELAFAKAPEKAKKTFFSCTLVYASVKLKEGVVGALNACVNGVNGVLAKIKERRERVLTKEQKTLRKYIFAFVVGLLIVIGAMFLGSYVCGILYGSMEGWFKDVFFAYRFSDFGQVIYFALAKNPYAGDFTTSYTPINVLLFKPFAYICSFNDAFKVPLTFDDVVSYNQAILQTPQFWLCYGIYLTLCVTALFFLLRGVLPQSRGTYMMFFGALMCSNIVIYGVVRGSNVLLTFVIITFFLRFKDSKNAILRELSYIALALAGAMKYYPLFFGIFLLRDKKFFESARVAVYTLLLILLPFLAIEGGFSNIPLYFGNLFQFTDLEDRIFAPRNISVASLVAKCMALLGDAAWVDVVSKVLQNIAVLAVFVLGTVYGLKAKEKFSVYVLATCVVTLVPSISYLYLSTFLIIPLLKFMKVNGEMSRPRRIYYGAFFIVMGCLIHTLMPNFTFITVFYLITMAVEILYIRQVNMSKFKDLVKKLYYDKRVRYLFVGVLNTIVGYGITLIMYLILGVDITTDVGLADPFLVMIATITGQVLGTVHSYFWNKYFTFRSRKKSFSEIVRFCIVYGVQYLANYGLTLLLKNVLNIPILFSQPIIILVCMAISYFGHNLFSFKNQDTEVPEENKEAVEESSSNGDESNNNE